MLLQYALIFSIIFQILAVVFVVSLFKSTKYNSSWILLSIGLFVMALRRVLDFLIPYVKPQNIETFKEINNWLGVVISILMVIGVFYLKKILRYLFHIQKIKAENEKRVMNAIIHTEESERKRFAKDLHDGLGPLLSSVKMSLSALSMDHPSVDKKQLIESSLQTVNDSITSLKEISNNLSPHILENFGVVKAIQSFCSKIEQSGKIPIHFRTNLFDQRFKGNIEVILYRSACELIHNTVQHAQAQTILISLDLEGNVLRLLYQDDGIGFDYQNVILNNKHGMGLHNLRSRIGSLNGSLHIDSLPGQGEVVTIEIPV